MRPPATESRTSETRGPGRVALGRKSAEFRQPKRFRAELYTGLPGHHGQRHRGMHRGALGDGRPEGTSIPSRDGRAGQRATMRGTWSRSCAREPSRHTSRRTPRVGGVPSMVGRRAMPSASGSHEARGNIWLGQNRGRLPQNTVPGSGEGRLRRPNSSGPPTTWSVWQGCCQADPGLSDPDLRQGTGRRVGRLRLSAFARRPVASTCSKASRVPATPCHTSRESPDQHPAKSRTAYFRIAHVLHGTGLPSPPACAHVPKGQHS
jgi:hypothetical protein